MLKADQDRPPGHRAFLYMPYMHSESPRIHEAAVALFGAAGLENNLDFEMKHKAIIDRFGRYPHRNDVLGRTNTAGAGRAGAVDVLGRTNTAGAGRAGAVDVQGRKSTIEEIEFLQQPGSSF